MGIKLLLRELGELFQINRDTKILKFGHWGVIKNIVDGEGVGVIRPKRYPS